jgi:hypothetical protein
MVLRDDLKISEKTVYRKLARNWRRHDFSSASSPGWAVVALGATDALVA